MDRLLTSGDLNDHQRDALENADTTTDFVRLAKRVGVPFRRVEATWPWPGRSVAEAVGTHPPDVIRWLATWSYKTCIRALAWSIEQARHQAFDHHPPDMWVPMAPGVHRPMYTHHYNPALPIASNGLRRAAMSVANRRRAN
jgi:hypothetical protein